MSRRLKTKEDLAIAIIVLSAELQPFVLNKLTPTELKLYVDKFKKELVSLAKKVNKLP